MIHLRRYPWKPALALGIAGALASPLLLPYALGLYAAAPTPKVLPAHGLVLVLLVILQSAVVLAVALGLGYPAARALGLGAPYVEAWVERRPPPRPPPPPLTPNPGECGVPRPRSGRFRA